MEPKGEKKQLNDEKWFEEMKENSSSEKDYSETYGFKKFSEPQTNPMEF